MPHPTVYTTASAAKFLGVSEWQVRRLFERNLLPAPPRAGLHRLIFPSDLPAVEQALVDAGYLRRPANPLPAGRLAL